LFSVIITKPTHRLTFSAPKMIRNPEPPRAELTIALSTPLR